MSFGVTSTGINVKTISDIQSSLRSGILEKLGDQINVESNSTLGSIIDAFAIELSKTHELMESVYNSQYPDTAEGVNLDNVVAITNIVRLGAAKSSVTGRITGSISTVVPIGFRASVSGDETAIFETVESGTITAGIDEVQTISFSAVPTSGSFKLNHGANVTGAIDFNDSNTDIQTALNGLASLSAVTVTGNFTDGFEVTFTGADGDQDQPLLTVSDNTLDSSGAVSVSVTETTKGYLPFVDLVMQSVSAGAIVANASSLTVIETPTAGVTAVTNLSNAVVGRDQETDADLRIRRQENLQTTQNGTDAGIRNKILNVTDVLAAKVSSNRTGSTVSSVPAHTIHAVVLGGTDSDIAEAIEDARPCGIGTYGATSVNVVDDEGETVSINFDRPTEVEIYMIVNVTENTDSSEGSLFPATGAQQIKDNILAFVESFTIGQDVIQNKLYTPINSVDGVIGVEVLIGTSASPTETDNISISNTQIAAFAEARITVNVA